jgi:hypothetical protein
VGHSDLLGRVKLVLRAAVVVIPAASSSGPTGLTIDGLAASPRDRGICQPIIVGPAGLTLC